MAKDWLEGVAERHDAVVIGSGLGGLTAARLLARQGAKVLVLEHHYQFGGLATWFRRPGGHLFDISLHGFPVGMVRSMRKYWSAELAGRIRRVPEVQFRNPQFTLSTRFDRADYERLLREAFGVQPRAIEGFFGELEATNFYDHNSLTTGELLERHFPERSDVHRFLLEPISYANGSTVDDPAVTYAIVFRNFMQGGVHIFTGGSQSVVEEMVRLLKEDGVELRRNVLVQRVVTEADATGRSRVRGVVAQSLNTGERPAPRLITAPVVISNASLRGTVLDLVGPEAVPETFAREVRGVRLNHSSCQVYFGFREGTRLPPLGDLVFMSEDARFDTESLTRRGTRSRTFSIYHPDLRPPAQQQRPAIVASYNARWEDWATLGEGEYAEAKAALVGDAKEALERLAPGLIAEVEHVEAATPRTVNRYTRHPMGASFGTKMEGLALSRRLPEEVPGLFHAGSVGIIMSGWLGTINYGVMVAHQAAAFLDAGVSSLANGEA